MFFFYSDYLLLLSLNYHSLLLLLLFSVRNNCKASFKLLALNLWPFDSLTLLKEFKVSIMID